MQNLNAPKTPVIPHNCHPVPGGLKKCANIKQNQLVKHILRYCQCTSFVEDEVFPILDHYYFGGQLLDPTHRHFDFDFDSILSAAVVANRWDAAVCCSAFADLQLAVPSSEPFACASSDGNG